MKHGILVDPVNAKPVELKDQFEDTDNWLTATKDINVMKQLLEEERDKTDRLEKKIVDLEKITDSLDTIRRGTTTLEFGSEVIPHIKYEFDLQTNKLSLTIDPDAVKAFYRKVYK